MQERISTFIIFLNKDNRRPKGSVGYVQIKSISKRQMSSSLSRIDSSVNIRKITPSSKSSSSPILPPKILPSPESTGGRHSSLGQCFSSGCGAGHSSRVSDLSQGRSPSLLSSQCDTSVAHTGGSRRGGKGEKALPL